MHAHVALICHLIRPKFTTDTSCRNVSMEISRAPWDRGKINLTTFTTCVFMGHSTVKRDIPVKTKILDSESKNALTALTRQWNSRPDKFFSSSLIFGGLMVDLCEMLKNGCPVRYGKIIL